MNDYYIKNAQYSEMLNSRSFENYKKIADTVNQYSKKDDFILDVGCGVGSVLNLIVDRDRKFGIDVSETSIKIAKEKGLNCVVYDGTNLPFEEEKFGLVYSFNVLEHVDNVEFYLSEMVRVLKRGGYLVIVFPNFLSITNSFHWHTAGFSQKICNFMSILKKIIFPRLSFQKMKSVEREDFHSDDDACNVTNPIDIMKWAKNNKLILKSYSCQSVYKKNLFLDFIDKTALKIFFGSCFLVFYNNDKK